MNVWTDEAIVRTKVSIDLSVSVVEESDNPAAMASLLDGSGIIET